MRELRQLARGIYPPVLHDFGLPVALCALADRSPFPVSVSWEKIGRYPQAIEAAVYYFARETIQHATKHAGPGANVAISLAAEPLAMPFKRR